MSRARPIKLPDGTRLWYDRHRNAEKASAQQLELLAAVEDTTLDDLLGEGLSQGEVVARLRKVLGQGVIPPEILERQRAAREAASREPECRICTDLGTDCEGLITRHHFIPRWMMLMLENYQSYAPRRVCTIPICVGRHRDLHLRGDEQTPKSIPQFMTDHERRFAAKLLDEFREQHPSTFDLIAGGDESTYEYVLIRDYLRGEFRRSAVKAPASNEVHVAGVTG